MFVLDANVFFTAHHDYYRPDLCPGFWDCLQHFTQTGDLSSIDQVRKEIKSPEKLVEWMKPLAGKMFRSTTEPETIEAFRRMQNWVNSNDQFKEAAKNEFGRVADGWIAAYAKANGFIVVTLEVFDPNVRKRVPIPNVCHKFKVRCLNTYEMLQYLGVQFSLNQSN